MWNLQKRTGKIWIPALLTGLAAIQSFGIDTGRAIHLRQLQDSLAFMSDSAVQVGGTVVSDMSDDATFVLDTLDTNIAIQSGVDKDTVILSARDTIIPPDSLRITDPFKFKYYVEIKDSLTRRHTKDSLLSAGDTLEAAKLDSLYISDSILVAKEKFALWYASLSKKERKRYDYEQKLPMLLQKSDSIMRRKDSIKARRDSIISATPRILETYAIPDSLQYKRIVTWTRDRKFNRMDFKELDTTYNYHFNDLPIYKNDVNAVHLGTSGSASMPYNYFKREEEENVIFYTPYKAYTFSPENDPMYNTKTPYTELAYWGTLFTSREKEEMNLKFLTTQNILPEWNVAFEFDKFGAKGLLKNEKTDNRNLTFTTNYTGKKYLLNAGYIYNKVDRTENGGIIDNFWIRDTTVDAREINVRLAEASNVTKKHTVFVDQSYRIPFNFLVNRDQRKKERALRDSLARVEKVLNAKRDSLLALGDSLAAAALFKAHEEEEDMPDEMGDETGEGMETAQTDTIVKDVTTAFIGHNSEYSVFTKLYNDKISASDTAGRGFYHNNFFINPTTTADSLRVMRLENKIYLSLQPWAEDWLVSKIDVGIGNKLLNYFTFNPNGYVVKSKNAVFNSTYLYAGARGKFKKYLSWDATGKYTFLGKEVNDFNIDANLSFSTYPFRRDKSSPITLTAHFETSLKEPDYYEQHIYTNHFKWDNEFEKISTTKVEASLEIPRWKLRAGFGYALLSNNLYYDNAGIIRQNNTPMSVITASLRKDFRVWKFHFDHDLLFQISSNDKEMPLPLFAANLRYYIQFDVVKNVMQMQIGANGRYNTKWYAPAWNPALGVFFNQEEEQYGNCANLDVFINIQWKRACIFIKAVNLNMGWPNKSADYFSAHHYINPQRTIKVGIFWPFYVQPVKNSSVSGKSGGSSSGSSGSSGASGYSGGSRQGGSRQAAIR